MYLKLQNLKKHCIIGYPFVLRNVKYISFGEKSKIHKGYRIECYDKYAGKKLNPKLEIKENTIIGYNFTCLVTENVTIGKNTIIASNVLITSENHGMNPIDNEDYYHQKLLSDEVMIGDGCWIGESVKIMPGVHIGNRSIIGASSVVTKDIPAYSVAVGCPAKIIKKFNFETEQWEKI